MKNKIKNIIGYFAYPFLKVGKNKQGITSVIFHHVDEKEFPSFKRLITQLDKEIGFIDPHELESFFSGRDNIYSKKILLTFDDGFKSNYFLAKSILDPINIKSILFVNPNFAQSETRSEQIQFMKENILVKSSDLNNPEIGPMSFADMINLVKNGHFIGSHTMNHLKLSKLQSKEDLYNEIVTSKLTLEKKIKIKVEHFAFPFGDINSISSEAMKLANQHYQYVHSGIRGLNSSRVKRYALRREAVSVNNNILYNQFVVNNGFSFFYRKQQLRLDTLV